MTGHALEGPLYVAARDERTELGIGDGWYVVGYDLRVAHRDRAKSQQVADAMRAAALLIGAAK